MQLSASCARISVVPAWLKATLHEHALSYRESEGKARNNFKLLRQKKKKATRHNKRNEK